MKKSVFSILLILLTAVFCYALTDQELKDVRDGFEQRRDTVLQMQVDRPFPGLKQNPDYQLFGWHKLDYALAALWMNQQLDEANKAIREVTDYGTGGRIANGEERFHWIAPLMIRTYELFNSKSKYFPGRLEPESEMAIRNVLMKFVRDDSILDRYDMQYVWKFYESENHDAQTMCSLWGGLKILKEAGIKRTLSDGHYIEEHYEAINKLVTERLRERVRKGLLVECATPTYLKYTLSMWYNYYDFGDEQLRKAADDALNCFWADWAQENFNGVRGGAKTRVYAGPSAELARGEDYSGLAWFYMGVGIPEYKHPGMMSLLTSGHRLPLVIMDIALDIEGRGSYEYISRRPGLYKDRDPAGYPRVLPEDHSMVLDPDYGGLLRYSYCTPDFIMGCWMLEKRSSYDWPGISSQNRWQGIIFNSDNPDSRIFPTCEGLGNGKTYNQFWSAQNKGTMVVCRMSYPDFSIQAGDMMVYFSSDLKKEEEGSIIFVDEADSYVAVRVSPYIQKTWDNDNWVRMSESMFPLVFEVARKKDYDSFEKFKSDVKNCKYELKNNVLYYSGLGGTGDFTFYYALSKLPEINGKPIDLNPGFTFKSPYIYEQWASGVVKISKDDREYTIDVND